MTVRFYSSTDVGAPVLNGQNGSLKNVLDACLVNGYGDKVAAGWTKHFDATNVAAYRQSTVGHPGFYLRVDDNFATQNEALIRGFQTMTDFNTGTGPFPTTAQATNGLFVLKRLSVAATAVIWRMVADSGRFYLFIDSYNNGNLLNLEVYYFGTFDSFVPGDDTNVIIAGRANTGSTNQFLSTTTTPTGTLSNAIYVAERHDNAESAPAFIPDMGMISGDGGRLGVTTGTARLRAINPANNSLFLTKAYICTDDPLSGARAIRGTLSGLRVPFGGGDLSPENTIAEGSNEYIVYVHGVSGTARLAWQYSGTM